MNKKIKIALTLVIGILFIPITIFSQEDNEFSLKKTPEQLVLEKEKKFLQFQDFFFEAIQERAKENYDKAIEALDNCHKVYPDNAAMNFEYAKNYLKLNQNENAAEFIEKVLQQKPNEEYIKLIAIQIYRKLYEYDKAIALQKELAAKKPHFGNGLIYLYLINKEKDKARDVYLDLEKQQLLDNRKDYFERVLFRKKKVNTPKITSKKDENSIIFEKQAFQKKKNFKNLKALLEKELQLKKYTELVVDSSEGLSLFPAQPYVYYVNGKALNLTQKFKKAIESLETGLDFIVENKDLEANFYNELSIAYLGIKNTTKATKYKQKALALRKTN